MSRLPGQRSHDCKESELMALMASVFRCQLWRDVRRALGRLVVGAHPLVNADDLQHLKREPAGADGAQAAPGRFGPVGHRDERVGPRRRRAASLWQGPRRGPIVLQRAARRAPPADAESSPGRGYPRPGPGPSVRVAVLRSACEALRCRVGSSSSSCTDPVTILPKTQTLWVTEFGRKEDLSIRHHRSIAAC